MKRESKELYFCIMLMFLLIPFLVFDCFGELKKCLGLHLITVMISLADSLQLREIKLDKVRPWKPFYKVGQQRVLAPRLLSDKRSRDHSVTFNGFNGVEMEKVGYEIYAEGPTRVLRICEISDCFKGDSVLDLRAKMQLRISQFAIHLLEPSKQVFTFLMSA